MKENFNIDLHNHIYLYDNYKKIIEKLEREKVFCLIVTNKPSKYVKYKYFSKYIKYALGYHPLEVDDDYKKEMILFLNELKTTRYVGEIGLDYNGSNIDKQKDIFQLILKLCNDKNKILSIHCRKAENDLVEYLKKFNGKVIIHWFSGNKTNLKKLIDLDCYFSINTNMIKAKKAEQYFEIIPINKILIETDAPYTAAFKTRYNISHCDKIYEYLSVKYNCLKYDVIKSIEENFNTLLYDENS